MNFWRKIDNWLKGEEAPVETTPVEPTEPTFSNPAGYYRVGGGWGNAVYWWRNDEWPEGKMPVDPEVYGFQTYIPEEGDVLCTDMSSGRVGVFVFTEVERKSDPSDMFFGKVHFMGYEDEIDMPERKARMFV